MSTRIVYSYGVRAGKAAKEWQTIKLAPFSFLIVCALAIGACTAGFKWYYGKKLFDAEETAEHWQGEATYWKQRSEHPDKQVVLPQEQAPKPEAKTVRTRRDSGLPSGNTINATTNAPDSAAVGINTGSITIGDTPPRFRLATLHENVMDGSSYRTDFRLEISAKRAILLHLEVTAPSLVDDLQFEREREPQAGGDAVILKNRFSGPGFIRTSVTDVEPGSYVISVHTVKPDKVRVVYRLRSMEADFSGIPRRTRPGHIVSAQGSFHSLDGFSARSRGRHRGRLRSSANFFEHNGLGLWTGEPNGPTGPAGQNGPNGRDGQVRCGG